MRSTWLGGPPAAGTDGRSTVSPPGALLRPRAPQGTGCARTGTIRPRGLERRHRHPFTFGIPSPPANFGGSGFGWDDGLFASGDFQQVIGLPFACRRENATFMNALSSHARAGVIFTCVPKDLQCSDLRITPKEHFTYERQGITRTCSRSDRYCVCWKVDMGSSRMMADNDDDDVRPGHSERRDAGMRYRARFERVVSTWLEQ